VRVAFAAPGLLIACAVAGTLACPGGHGSPRPVGSGPPPGLWHQAHAGEKPDALAQRYRVPLEDILESNGLEAESRLRDGQVVFIPGGNTDQVRRASRATAPSSQPERTGQRAAAPGRGDLLWPVPAGKVTSGFGPRGKRPHEGIDLAASEGEKVLAAADGTVIYAGSGVRGYGNLILLRHPGGLITVYAHNRSNLVKEKETVRAGQVIAEVGHTGNASANHLHFEVRRGEVPEDPLAHLPPLR
jgi:murein DD-endopeptidase MepM/ murein hydrolase activator NlpD